MSISKTFNSSPLCDLYNKTILNEGNNSTFLKGEHLLR